MMKAYSAPVPAPESEDQSQTYQSHNKISHEHRVKVMLIRAMEAELDLSKVAPERELMAMTTEEIDNYKKKVHSAHKNWFEAQQMH
jgi:hypothetical protein